jgi:hypothetical protein
MRRYLWIVGVAAAAGACGQTYNVTIDANLSKRAINPLIYGTAWATQAQLQDLNFTGNRIGGDNSSRYNWRLNADNRAFDFFFESIGDTNSTAAYRVDNFIQGNKAANAQSFFTIPLIPWIANLGSNRSTLYSFSVKKYGPQTKVDPNLTDAGNGISTAAGNPFITGNNVNDANVANSPGFESGLFAHLVEKWGTAAKGGLKFYEMDNESSVWYSTHRDVHPIGPKMDEIAADMEDYATAVKNADPTAMVLGPEEWGWSGFFYSGYDQQYTQLHNFNGVYPDRAAHNNVDYIPYLLEQMKTASTNANKRLLDVLSLHFYPQDGSFTGGVTAPEETLRNQSTRALWDPNYTDQSWIGTQIQLIPRMQSWVNTYYPGTLCALTEYNWGAEPYINGATTQADILGIFGKYGLDMATRWETPDPSTPTYKAMKMFRNYDGADSVFGDTSISDTGSDPDNLASYAATRTADGYMTVMIINKITTTGTVNLTLNNFSSNGTAQVYQLTSANTINHLASLTGTATKFTVSAPGQSITLLVIPPSTVTVQTPPTPTGLTAYPLSKEIVLVWSAATGATSYRVLRNTAATGTFTQIATVATPSCTNTGLTNGTKYYYKVEAANAAGASAPTAAIEVTPVAETPDPAEYNFETGAQGWTDTGGSIASVADSFHNHYLGEYSLAVNVKATGTDTQYAYVPSPSVAAGKTVTFHVYIPTGCKLLAVQPYVQQGATGGWTFTGNYVNVSSLTAGAWNTIAVTVPANAVTPLYELGVEFDSNTAWSGTCYIDSVSW